MNKSRLNPDLLSQVLQETLPAQAPSLAGYTSDWGLFLAAYENYHNCYVPKHNNSFHTLEIIDESPLLFHRRIMGDYEIQSRLSGGEVSIYPANTDYFFDSSEDNIQGDGVSFTLVTLDANLIEELLRQEFGCSQVELIPQFLVIETQQIRSLVNIIKQEIRDGYPNGNIFLEDMRNALIRCLLRKSAIFSKSISQKDINLPINQRVQLVKEILREDVKKNISLEDLEKDLGISKFHISRSFKQAEGISITYYLKQIRVEQAQQLLMNQPWSIATIAQECGFHDSSHLNKCFKAMTGITPTQFREQFQKKIDIY